MAGIKTFVFGADKPDVPGVDEEAKQRQRDQEDRAKQTEENARKQVGASTRAIRNRSAGRRLLLAEGRESDVSKRAVSGDIS